MNATDPEGNPVRFDIEVREFSKQNRTGGKYKVYSEACLLRAEKRKGPKGKGLFLPENKERKNPGHFKNRSRNLELPSGDIKKINILFIIRFNGKNVIY